MTPSDPPTAESPAPAVPRYWLMSLGRNAEKWDECYDEGIACIGWDQRGDLEQYEDREQLQLGRNDSLACWQFSRDMKPGDVVFAKQGTSRLLGHGTVQSDYRFDDTRPEFKNVRDVEWHSKLAPSGNQPEHGFPQKTLTDITPYEALVCQLKLEVGLAPRDAPLSRLFEITVVKMDPERTQRIADYLQRVHEWPADGRGNRDFHELVWKDDTIWQPSPGHAPEMDKATDDAQFREWFAEELERPLPNRVSDPDGRIEALQRFYNAVRERVKPLYSDELPPQLTVLRGFAALFPLDFTGIARLPKLFQLLHWLGHSCSQSRVVRANSMLLRERDSVLGEVSPADWNAVAQRMELHPRIYEAVFQRTPEEEKEEDTEEPRDQAEQVLTPLPAVERFKGLDAVSGGLGSILLCLRHVAEQRPDTEALADFIQSENPRLARGSAKHKIWVLGSQLALFRKEGERHLLSDVGTEVLERGNADPLRARLLTRIFGVDHLLLAVRKEAMPRSSAVALLQGANPGWTTGAVPSMTYKMLMNFDVLGESDLGHLHLTERGQEWANLITWKPEAILRKEPKPTPDTDRIDLRETLPSLKEILKHFDQLKDADDPLIFPGKTVEALHAGLWTDARRHFAVLTGLSGTGKTRLAREYAKAIAGDEHAIATITVQPGWYDSAPLLGHVNPLRSDEFVRPAFLELLLRAADRPAEPHFAILDEMNLSHVEQYLAPLLSAMETGDELDLHGRDEEDISGVPGQFPYPPNLVVIGTVNMDETTVGISDKVLDRAFTLEFWEVEVDQWPGWSKTELGNDEELVRGTLKQLMDALSPARLHFGWRVIKEVVGFVERAAADGGSLDRNEALDRVIYAKVLPKLRGDDSVRLREALQQCRETLKQRRLPDCARKVSEMESDLSETGSVRFWR